ncbi:hypothetical protein FRX31_020701 [Thalictrum thalictroides]|uniref:Uncharacterized protein n=1 Tax=Thalictrum thalictroides TaxID=46969 RepID=A0A7J6VYD2_THATH|nr:hypothetical protein FRX31_020701 [Thalictrum thalictroides]
MRCITIIQLLESHLRIELVKNESIKAVSSCEESNLAFSSSDLPVFLPLLEVFNSIHFYLYAISENSELLLHSGIVVRK